mmetsp:Transcript_17349/g.44260  ORF Transcript_17349/g.44260 Transcript_17349/m.44260 type:complete len:298 (-) Transcript_17349:81-974(-)
MRPPGLSSIKQIEMYSVIRPKVPLQYHTFYDQFKPTEAAIPARRRGAVFILSVFEAFHDKNNRLVHLLPLKPHLALHAPALLIPGSLIPIIPYTRRNTWSLSHTHRFPSDSLPTAPKKSHPTISSARPYPTRTDSHPTRCPPHPKILSQTRCISSARPPAPSTAHPPFNHPTSTLIRPAPAPPPLPCLRSASPSPQPTRPSPSRLIGCSLSRAKRRGLRGEGIRRMRRGVVCCEAGCGGVAMVGCKKLARGENSMCARRVLESSWLQVSDMGPAWTAATRTLATSWREAGPGRGGGR